MPLRPSVVSVSLVILAGFQVSFAADSPGEPPIDPAGAKWRCTTTKPPAGWEKPDFSDADWDEGPGGFGKPTTPGSAVHTRWQTDDIWLRRKFELDQVPKKPALLIHHDEDAEVFINGTPVARFQGFLKGYRVARLDKAACKSITVGENLLAVHCRQTVGGQYIDVHLVGAEKVAKLVPGIPPAETVWSEPVLLRTVWADQSDPEKLHPEYPRPQMVRDKWMNLNGRWDYAIVGEEGEWTEGRVENATFDPLLEGVPRRPDKWDGKIVVPFSPEVTLSGVKRLVRPNQLLWYRRTFQVPADWEKRRVRLNFEAVDWHAIVLVNGRQVADNKGGYVPFSCDITDAVTDSPEQELLVVVWDPTNMGDQTIGKQSLPELRRGFRYTPNSGIWQTVWMEPVPENAIGRLKIVPDVDRGTVTVVVSIRGDNTSGKVTVQASQSGRPVSESSGPAGKPVTLKIPDARLWCPADPFLYDLKVALTDGRRTVDQVASYFGMRQIGTGLDRQGITRILLNGEPIFQYGPLDQGYWPDGAMTPSSDAAAEFDVRYLREIGCNMARVHVTVHPDRWYYYCDRLGLLVWQDFVCSRKFDTSIVDASAAQWELEQRRMIDNLHNHPSVVHWVVFNEGWGQYDTERLTEWTKAYDPSRLVTCASGWTDYPVGDVYDNHDYSFSPSAAIWSSDANKRPVLLGECGGHNVYVERHVWYPDRVRPPETDPIRDAGRETYADGAEWLARYRPWLVQLRLLQAYGLNAAVYTQITDVEHECNGWLTYDRRVSKIDEKVLKKLHDRLYRPPKTRSLLPAHGGPVRHTLVDQPPQGWTEAGFDDGRWPTVSPDPAGNVTLDPVIPAAADRQQLLVRWPLELEAIPAGAVAMRIGGWGQYDVYLNGQPIKSLNNSLRSEHVPGSAFVLHAEALKQLKANGNLLAIRIAPVGPREGRKPGRLVHFELLEVVE